MKSWIVFALVLGGVSFARAQEPDASKFETHKAEALKEIDERIAKLQEHKTCVSSASNQDALKTCREAMKDFHMQQRNERIDKRMHRLEEKKKNNK